MIYYFSGTGNSRYVAETLSEYLQENVRQIANTDASGEIPAGDSIGFVFPVYSWGVPPLVLRFIEALGERFWGKVKGEGLPVWCVMTCGDEVALAPEMITKTLRKSGIEPESIWSVIMPNNYVILPGFDVDTREVEKEKLRNAPERIREIASGISAHRKELDVVRGGMPWLKSKLVYPLFKRWGIFPKKWRSTDACVGCGICVRNCPCGNMEMEGGRPKWGDNCSSCLACYHSCPRHAVEYGNSTRSKGQYFHP